MIKKILPFLGLSLILTACGPVDPYDDGHSEHHMAHEQYEVPGTMALPNLNIELTPDPKSGWNLQIITENFEFDPESASLEHEDGKGHTHLYINNHKITRLYNEWNYLPEDLFPVAREYEVRVTLNTNDHKDYALNGEVIEAVQTIQVQ